MRAKRLTIKQRKEIFRALVALQDSHSVSPAESINMVGKQFQIDEQQVRQIADEGVEKDWLDEVITPAN
jgi:hypothetical protein